MRFLRKTALAGFSQPQTHEPEGWRHDNLIEYSVPSKSHRVLYISPLGQESPEFEHHWTSQGFYLLRAFDAHEAIPLIMTHHFELVLLAEENTNEDKAAILDVADQLGVAVITRNRYRDSMKRAG